MDVRKLASPVFDSVVHNVQILIYVQHAMVMMYTTWIIPSYDINRQVQLGKFWIFCLLFCCDEGVVS